jgi:hypothetical protein
MQKPIVVQRHAHARFMGVLLAASLVWLANAVGISRQAGAPSGGEAIVSFERIGPDGTSAG